MAKESNKTHRVELNDGCLVLFCSILVGGFVWYGQCCIGKVCIRVLCFCAYGDQWLSGDHF